MAVFDETTTIDDVTVDSLVGEGKKFKTVDDLAKGKAESDRVIAARERELAELREELSRRATVEDTIRNLTATPNQSAAPVQEPKPAASAPSFTDEDLVARIREVTQAQSEQQRIQANVAEVANKLTDLYGSEEKANAVVNQKARELGVSVDFLQEVAAKSPKAFFTTIGATDVTPTGTPSASHSDVNPQVLADTRPGPQPGTYAFYENIRKTDPERYFKPAIQNALMKDALKASKEGRDFYRA